jgi:hypothetical protein
MIVEEPRTKVSGDEVTVEAAVRLEAPGPAVPPTLWFAFPRTLGDFVTTRSDGFGAALLPLAMRLGERLLLRGELSCRLAQGMRDYQRIQSAWKPELFRTVEIECDRLASLGPGEGTGAVGAAFSGGVDSFHTLWTHLAENERYRPFAITHCLMINGFDQDSDLDGTGSFRWLQGAYEPMMAVHGLSLLVVRTNLLQFLGPLVQKQAFAAFVTAPALALGGLFSRFYLPSSYKFTLLKLFPDGSHPMLDHLLGTESMETIHDGGHLTRVEKTVELTRWPETHDLLRVCFGATGVREDTGAIANCCRCEKCVRTMLALELAGALPHYRCFALPLERKSIWNADYRWPGSRIFAEELIGYATARGRQDVVRDVRRAILNSVWLRPPVHAVLHASYTLEQRSRLYATAIAAPKSLLKRIRWGHGWLY